MTKSRLEKNGRGFGERNVVDLKVEFCGKPSCKYAVAYHSNECCNSKMEHAIFYLLNKVEKELGANEISLDYENYISFLAVENL